MNLFEEYVVLDDQIRRMTEKKENLRTEIIIQMSAQQETKVVTDFGNFTIAKLKTWTYPEKVLALNEKFKAAKAKAESTGDATYVETESLRFTKLSI